MTISSFSSNIPARIMYVPQVTFVDRSSTITLGGTPQQLLATNVNRCGGILYNSSASDLEIYPSGFTGHLTIPSKGYFEFPAVDTGVWMIKGAITAQSFTFWEYQNVS